MSQTYTVTAFWLRERMNNVAEAEPVLHEGLRNCPDSYDILFELGRLYYESYHDRDAGAERLGSRRAAVAEAGSGNAANRQAARHQTGGRLAERPTNLVETQKDNRLVMEQLTTHLGKLEEDADNLPQAIQWFQAAQRVSDHAGRASRSRLTS